MQILESYEYFESYAGKCNVQNDVTKQRHFTGNAYMSTFFTSSQFSKIFKGFN